MLRFQLSRLVCLADTLFKTVHSALHFRKSTWFFCQEFCSQGFRGRENDPVVCLQNSATIRRTLPIGPNGEVTVADIETMMPPEEALSLTIMEVTLDDLKLALENSVSALNTALNEVPDGRFLHVGAMQVCAARSGIQYQGNHPNFSASVCLEHNVKPEDISCPKPAHVEVPSW